MTFMKKLIFGPDKKILCRGSVLLKIKIYQQITIKIFNIEFTAADVSSK
jgi:hypothetical protein